ncbi:hypothetical protein CCH79_00000212 [Gambusia affinis]|uniref:Integrase catalytic domain-containing protein n=1 Tax=Gambusia affinis TaxID=33528 RepID=A0A315W7T7_GAMAF|nr:hypothetical protein CCH79_00000212 [Gambusia affinis]
MDSLAERFVKFSNWSRLVKAIARLIRFGKEFKRMQKRTNEATSLEERQEAELTIIAIVQGSVFSKEIKELQSRVELTKDKTSKLYRLNPFLDHKNVLRVGEGRKELKRYGLLFTCLCSRAIHIELLDDLSTDAFLNSLRAFIALRGNVRQLRSDQGTNFVGAVRELLEAIREMNQENLKQLGCEFVMNPPSASHMGGAWERQIRTIRSVLSSILDQSSRTLDSSSLRTYLYEVMAIVNSRPITPHLLNDPSGPQPLTPNLLLTLKTSVILPPPGDFVRQDLYLRKRWRRVQYLANEFWHRWRKEYLLGLQQRQKWQKTRRNAKVNDIVIIKDEAAPRNDWKLAKVTAVYPSEDGYVRKHILTGINRVTSVKPLRPSQRSKSKED